MLLKNLLPTKIKKIQIELYLRLEEQIVAAFAPKKQ